MYYNELNNRTLRSWQLFSWSRKFPASLKPLVINYIYSYLPQDLILTHIDQSNFQIRFKIIILSNPSFAKWSLLSGNFVNAFITSCYLPLQIHPFWFACNNMWSVVLQIMDEICAFSHIKTEFPTFWKLSPPPLKGTGNRIRIISETSEIHFVLKRLAVKVDSLHD